jgi:septal ring factor EnvC (AmiA/AmiB activator)
MKKRIVLILFFLLQNAFTEDSLTQEIEENRKKLQDLKQEIRRLQKSINASQTKEVSILEQVKLIDKEMSVLGKAKQLLSIEITLLTRKVSNTRQALQKTETRLKKYKKEAAERMVHNYKNGKVRNLELLIDSDSFNQALVRYKYLQLFAEQESQLLQSIRKEVATFKSLEAQLKIDLKNQRTGYQEKEREERNYIAKKAEKESAIRTIHWDRKTKQKLLNDRKESQDELTAIITRLLQEQEQTSGKPAIHISGDPFKKRKGKLHWPVKGKLLHTYGKQKDKKLKTTVNNTGIDIYAQTGTLVRAVYDGRVSLVTYLTGYGNTIIIDHGDGYYTVYAHFEEIQVEDGDLISEGDIIGRVGDSGSLEGPKLHFEIYANDLTVNPQQWLTKI